MAKKSPNKEKYVRGEECQLHVGMTREKISTLTRESQRYRILSRVSGPASVHLVCERRAGQLF